MIVLVLIVFRYTYHVSESMGFDKKRAHLENTTPQVSNGENSPITSVPIISSRARGERGRASSNCENICGCVGRIMHRETLRPDVRCGPREV